MTDTMTINPLKPYRLSEAAELLNYHRETLRAKCSGGQIEAVRFGGGGWRIMGHVLMDMLGIEPEPAKPATKAQLRKRAEQAAKAIRGK